MMNLYVQGTLTERFIRYLMPKYIGNLLNLHLSHVSKQRKLMMSEYLKKEHLPDILSILDCLKENMFITVKGNEYIIIGVNDNKQVQNQPLKPLLKLIEYGNMDIKGLDFINDSFQEAKRNADKLFILYKAGMVR